MTPTSDLQPCGERLRQAVRWVSDTLQAFPDKKRQDVLREAEVRFDLTPRECEYLNRETPCPPPESDKAG